METRTLYVAYPNPEQAPLIDLTNACRETGGHSPERQLREAGFSNEEIPELLAAERRHSQGLDWITPLSGKLRALLRSAVKMPVEGGFKTLWTHADGTPAGETGARSYRPQ